MTKLGSSLQIFVRSKYYHVLISMWLYWLRA